MKDAPGERPEWVAPRRLSLAVDSQGFIYVADEINKRIQKFAP